MVTSVVELLVVTSVVGRLVVVRAGVVVTIFGRGDVKVGLVVTTLGRDMEGGVVVIDGSAVVEDGMVVTVDGRDVKEVGVVVTVVVGPVVGSGGTCVIRRFSERQMVKISPIVGLCTLCCRSRRHSSAFFSSTKSHSDHPCWRLLRRLRRFRFAP